MSTAGTWRLLRKGQWIEVTVGERLTDFIEFCNAK